MYKKTSSLYTPNIVASHYPTIYGIIFKFRPIIGCTIPWDCIWLKDNNSCLVTFSVIDYSYLSLIFYVSSSLIFCLSRSSSSGMINIDVREPAEVGPKYCLIFTLTPIVRTRSGCSGHLIAVVSTSWHPWATKLPYADCSSRESYNQQKMKLITNYCCHYI